MSDIAFFIAEQIGLVVFLNKCKRVIFLLYSRRQHFSMNKKDTFVNSQNDADESNYHNKTLITTDSLESSISEANILYKDQIKFLDGQKNYESVTFIWLDPQSQLIGNIIKPLRMINNYVESYVDPLLCLTAMESTDDRIFFICTSVHTEIIAAANAIPSVEAIFMLNLDGQSIDIDFVKLFGVYKEQEELFRALKETLEAFERITFEEFLFEQDNGFLWIQLWKAQVTMMKE